MLIIGGGVAAMRCGLQLRRQGYEGSVRMVSAEATPPYDRTLVSKDLLPGDAVDDQRLLLRPPAVYSTRWSCQARGVAQEGPGRDRQAPDALREPSLGPVLGHRRSHRAFPAPRRQAPIGQRRQPDGHADVREQVMYDLIPSAASDSSSEPAYTGFPRPGTSPHAARTSSWSTRARSRRGRRASPAARFGTTTSSRRCPN